VNVASTCFLDTSALYALFDRAQEENDQVTSAWGELVRSDAPLVTSNYVVVELTALLQRRLGLEAVEALADLVLPFLDVIWIDQETHGRALSILQATRRQDVSLVDCSSFALMRGRGIRRAFVLDGHFAEQGFACLPQ
jgi:Predicted nucleic acid-binding protein, contains PIN domain